MCSLPLSIRLFESVMPDLVTFLTTGHLYHFPSTKLCCIILYYTFSFGVDYIQRWGRPNILYYIILWMSCAPTGTASIGFQSQCNSYKHGLIYVCVFMHNTDLNGCGAVTKSTAAGAVDQYSLSWTSSCLSRPDSAGACTLCQQVMSFILWLL